MVSQEQIENIYKKLYTKNINYFKLKEINNAQYDILQYIIIIGIYHLNRPRRLMDYTEMKIKNIDKNKDIH
jgi:hypothetical protein